MDSPEACGNEYNGKPMVSQILYNLQAASFQSNNLHPIHVYCFESVLLLNLLVRLLSSHWSIL